MNILDQIQERAIEKQRHIVLPEGHDPRTILAAKFLKERNVCRITVIGKRDIIEAAAAEAGYSLSSREIIDPVQSELTDGFARELFQIRKAKGMTLADAQTALQNELYFGAFLVKSGRCNGSVAGAANTTGNVIKAGLHVLGMAPGMDVVSSSFLMVLPDERIFTFGDCAIVPNPSPAQLASIAIASARTHEALTGTDARIAMLSFSTKGSARHAEVDKVLEALAIIKDREPELSVDGELQLDAAILPGIGAKKAPGSPVAGQANVLVFPDLNSGNIGYKLVQRLAGAEAVGPTVQGLSAPFMDLSRGCSWQDIANVAGIAALLS
jgi:phosphate acetyltransferase